MSLDAPQPEQLTNKQSLDWQDACRYFLHDERNKSEAQAAVNRVSALFITQNVEELEAILKRLPEEESKGVQDLAATAYCILKGVGALRELKLSDYISPIASNAHQRAMSIAGIGE